MKIVFRADDAGSSEGANRAIVETVREGVVRNVSVMVPGPAFEHAVPLLRGLDANLGLHVTLSAEWDDPKWGPVLPASQVPTLLGRDDAFTESPRVLHERGFSVEEAMAEVAAQLSRARAAGLWIEYLDEHMGVGWISTPSGNQGGVDLERLGDRLRAFAAAEGLVYAGDVPYGRLDDLSGSGPVAVVFHPGSDDDPVMARFLHAGLEKGQIHAERTADRRLACDSRLREHESITYRQAVA